jgi:hypothetical protein
LESRPNWETTVARPLPRLGGGEAWADVATLHCVKELFR